MHSKATAAAVAPLLRKRRGARKVAVWFLASFQPLPKIGRFALCGQSSGTILSFTLPLEALTIPCELDRMMTDLAERAAKTMSGLTDAEAAARLVADGPNELLSGDHRTGIRIVLDVIKEPMLALLLSGGAIYALLG